MRDYSHVLARVFNTPLAVTPDKADLIAGVIRARVMAAPRERAFYDDGDYVPPLPRSVTASLPGISLIPITGVLVHQAYGAEPPSGFMSYTEIEESVTDAATDGAVKAIMLDYDSPGGEATDSLFQCAAAIREAAGIKPVWALVDDICCSAAYMLASGCSRILMPQKGYVGSLGVIAMFMEQSKSDALQGFTYTTVFAGARKNDFNPHEPLAKEALASLRESVNGSYVRMTGLIAAHRHMSIADVQATEAAVYGTAQEAIKAGLVDAIAPSPSAVLAQLAATFDPNARVLAAPAAAGAAGSTATRAAAAAPMDAPQEQHMDPNVTQPGTQPATTAAAVPIDRNAINPAPQQTATVTDIAQHRDAGYAEAAEIVELCGLAGLPQLAAEMIGRKLTAAAARKELQAARAKAQAPATHSAHTGGLAPAEGNHGWPAAFDRARALLGRPPQAKRA